MPKPNGKKKDGNINKIPPIAIYIIMAIAFTLVVNTVLVSMQQKNIKEINYDAFENVLISKKEDKIIIYPKKQEVAQVQKGIGSEVRYYTGIIEGYDLVSFLNENGVSYRGDTPDEVSPVFDFIVSWVLFPLVIVYFLKILSKSMGKKINGGVMNFGGNSEKIYAEKKTGVKFTDVAGQEEAKNSLYEIVDFLHNPGKYTAIGAKLPKGALLVGPPGTGKTLLAKAVAGEAEVPFFSITGSDFVEMFVGVGASRVRDLFKQAEQKAPCIVFIDEIDAIGKSRDGQMQGSNDERENTLNQLLSEMDGFDSSKGVVILAATNRPEILDKALLRPGRFDRRIIVDKPDIKGRIDILKVHAKDVKMDKEIDLEAIALATSGTAGADLANIINEAALRAVKMGRNAVLQEDLFEAVEVVIAGQEKKDRVMNAEERKIVAFHEIGHALVAAKQKNTQPVHKITIVPRTSGALGYTMQMPEQEKYLMNKNEIYAEIAILMGGRAAEEVEFNIATTGASNDIERATGLARKMVSMYGMSERFGMMALESTKNQYLDGRQVQTCANETAAILDEEVGKIINGAYETAKQILIDNISIMREASEFLISKETITGEEFMNIVNHS
jgi:cell division protease FtsH